MRMIDVPENDIDVNDEDDNDLLIEECVECETVLWYMPGCACRLIITFGTCQGAG